jgi:hypothetical protein
MGIVRFVVVTALVVCTASVVRAQTEAREMTPLEVAVACAPPTSFNLPENALRITGSQDTVSRTLFGERDLLVLSGGTKDGIRLGQRYYIRRPIYFGTNRTSPQGLLTLGWLSVVSLNETMAIGAIDHFCAGIFSGDYLEPFTPPVVPATAEGDMPEGEPDFSAMGHVLYGVENHSAGGWGDLMLIDRGEDHGVAVGARFAVYRDVHAGGVPLSSVGEGVVVSLGKKMSLARITRSRDAIVSGDYVVPRK